MLHIVHRKNHTLSGRIESEGNSNISSRIKAKEVALNGIIMILLDLGDKKTLSILQIEN